ncbi:glutamine amidotransferase [candidate division MSBL1 archaeon SCGC-AAA259E17]|uniref:Pyridoxal 5'-phosphate synthase subunit PdxT n=1 Tax=candidate division MSBL1 archaeon SCGC-AAA259E17 TaxID=1698263 RepID=A0A133UG95_9EURY|nr:glutamine amidotransferase [candidate division MSBL1 archaeon SCGC-AAA259E17]
MKIGVIGFQGAVNEHITATERAMRELGLSGEAIWLKDDAQLSEVDGLIIPGGESTTIGRLISNAGIFEKIQEMGKSGVPILGTCAGLILLAKEGGEEIKETKQPLLKLMDMKVIRNAFGRQKESFETDLEVPAFGEKPFPGIFIRAPAIEEVWGNVRTLAKSKGKIVAAEQENLLAMAFHPELTSDTRTHQYYLEKVERNTS